LGRQFVTTGTDKFELTYNISSEVMIDDQRDEAALKLTPEQIELVNQAYASKKRGESRTSEQILKTARKKVQTWHPKKDQSA